ncbi:PREDICTED: O-acetyl-ADP-ribose deacetylase 1-like isoform X2 [Priapulus caudatus]|nr:PREDICTED: O-acetyl-ADP-ribose deacetylase 1-like isoform X2 [Priapulus caudatus]XP_014677690.1 PREDICTED: O-acetyl-ADP-ribose deacetylase 1-like isoform X2 [Priapulus caudatus]XP_014677697.1 PREDICTED: O-acetyl-ADP-ribose deacetylase 1-like isoform X2 [Priapulus caudatus]XP_014677705.1 PREDICTED: O-acetyl-ADP-ribose deacetylase 1-like isoform X2 [Priapulus caudatus]
MSTRSRISTKMARLHHLHPKRPGQAIPFPKNLNRPQFNYVYTQPTTKVHFEEVIGDLFSSPDSTSLAHCISEDCACSRGIALEFKNRFAGISELRKQGKEVGDIAVVKDGNRYLYNMVTKKKFCDKPTIEDLEKCLVQLRNCCRQDGVTNLAMPKIGCGLDELKWFNVRLMIQNVFEQESIKITICSH